MKRLDDAAALRAVVARAGAELLLHGHDHRFNAAEIAGPAGGVPVHGVPSASALPDGRRPGAHYQLHRISRGDGTWRVELSTRGYSPASGRFEAVDTGPRAAAAAGE